RCACTTYMIYRGPHEHEFVGSGVPGAIAGVTGMSRSGFGPSELVYGDIFDSLGTPCRSSFGVPGRRDQHTACAAIELFDHGSYDFLLLSFPDNDNYSHREGPEGQPVSIAHADEQLQRVVDAYGGYRKFMEDHAVIVVSDHSHSKVNDGIDLLAMLREHEWEVLAPRKRRGGGPRLAASPAARVGNLYVLDEDKRGIDVPLLVHDLRRQALLDQVLWLEDADAVVAMGDAELHFAPGSQYTDTRGLQWDVEGDLDALGLVVTDDQIASAKYPDGLARAWSGLHCPGSGDVMVTPELGFEFFDWGGVAHVGGGTHGSLHHEDSAAQLIVTGTGDAREHQAAWSIADVNALVLKHFGVTRA
ncbi:MAG: alkaline phosphatase family protein, partial [Solirubrobacterales bacterium]